MGVLLAWFQCDDKKVLEKEIAKREEKIAKLEEEIKAIKDRIVKLDSEN